MKMKYLARIVVITFILFGSTSSLFAENEIVYIDMNKILTESKVGIFVEKALTKIHKKNLDDFEKAEELLKKEEIDLVSKRNIMQADEFNEKANALRDKNAEYQKQRRAKFDSINEKRNKATQDVMEVLQPILADYAEQNQISIILEKKGIIVGKNALDISAAIIDELDKKLPSVKLN